jgi:hypothetical protein
MVAGLQVFGADGSKYTEVTDRLTCMVAEGVVNLPYKGSVFIPSLGVSDTGEWFVSVAKGNIGIPSVNGFTIYQTGESGAGNCRYSLFRR